VSLRQQRRVEALEHVAERAGVPSVQEYAEASRRVVARVVAHLDKRLHGQANDMNADVTHAADMELLRRYRQAHGGADAAEGAKPRLLARLDDIARRKSGFEVTRAVFGA
jgi:hypothetical protein